MPSRSAVSVARSNGGWHFDHVNLAVSQPESLVEFFGDVLGWHPGHRPAFPFPGHWLYDGDAAVLHLQTVAGANPSARLAHLAFRTERAAEELLRAVRASGLEFEVMRHLEKPAVQIFVRLPGGFVLELEAPTSQAVAGSRDYHAPSEQDTRLFRDVGPRADESPLPRPVGPAARSR